MSTSRIPANRNLDVAFDESRLREIWLAGGCFWGTEAFLARLPGVADAQSGYANGSTEKPTYEDVCRRNTGHAETVRVRYDPDRIPLPRLLEAFFSIIDPTVRNRQGNDVGTQYRTGIYYRDEADGQVARAVAAAEQERRRRPVVTEVEPLRNWHPAEEYHQDYLEKNPGGYCHVDFGRLAGFLADPAPTPVLRSPATAGDDPAWRRPADEALKTRLPPLSVSVLLENATEPPFRNEYWNERRPGLYVDRGTGEPLFSSRDKFDSDCGWPSFTRPLEPAAVTERKDRSLFMVRTEVRSRAGDYHLGHVFADGPRERGGLRYCINSAAVRFIPLEEMEAAGYGAYRDRVI